MSIGIIFSIASFNGSGVFVTKYASAANRATVDILRILFVWIFSVMIGLEKFNGYLLPGFILLVLGFVIYNEIIVLPIWDLDKYT